MMSRNLVWIDQVDLGSADLLKESRRHLEFLHDQLRVTGMTLDESRSSIDESWELLARLSKLRPGHYLA